LENSTRFGSGITNGSFATATVTNSTISDNSGGRGGDFTNHGNLLLVSSTITGNTASEGGGIYRFED